MTAIQWKIKSKPAGLDNNGPTCLLSQTEEVMESFTGNTHGSDNKPIFYRSWLPDDPSCIKSIIHIAHGMAEHSKRYERFAEQCVQQNIGVYAHDHRGHGHTGAKDMLGHYSDINGWSLILSDMKDIQTMIKRNHPDVPLFLLGHSMGSFISQGYVFRHRPELAGLILSGSNYSHPIKFNAARWIAKLERLRKGRRFRSKLLNHLSFGTFNNQFKPAHTEFDWLSSDPEEVQKYIEDPHCGFLCTTQLWCDLLKGLISISKESAFKKVSKNLPILIFGGQDDPVGQQGSGLIALTHQYQSAGISDVNLQLYPNGRHEMLNEVNHVEVGNHLISWVISKSL